MQTAADLLSHRARLTPSREAVYEVATGRRYSYAELNARACRAANLLRERYGVGAGDRVSILAHNGVAYLDLLYGLAKIGATLAPLNWRLTAAELRFIVGDLEPRVLLVGPEFAGVVGELGLPEGAAVLGVEGAGAGAGDDYEALLAAASRAEPDRPAGLDAESPLCILYTSGTTGLPKGAVIPHRQVLWNAIATAASWGLREDDVSPVFTPLFHSGGLFAFLTPILYLGGRIVLGRTFDAAATLRQIEAEGCTVILGVPTLFQMWAESPEYRAVELGRVRFFISGGAPCPPALMQRWRREKGVAVRQGFGMTEVGVNCFSMTDEEAERHAGSVGKPILHSEVRLVDPESGRDAAEGEPGELWIRGPHVCSGYWRRPEATAEVLRDGWFRTGDTFRRDADGFYHVVGRYKDMIKSGGENVYAAEVEAVFREHPAVADAALVGEPDPKWGEVGVMAVVRQPGADCAADELLAHCEGRLARYKIPRRVVFLDALPYSPYGKVVKAELRAALLSPPAPRA